MARTRPTGITIFAILTAIQGIILIAAPLFTTGLAPGATTNASLAAFSLILFIVLGVISLVLAWGLWTLKAWAWRAIVITEVIALINGLFSIVQSGGSVTGVSGIVMPILILLYFYLGNVRQAFGVERAT